MKTSSSASSSSAAATNPFSTPFASPLGGMHHAPPSTQGETVRALFSLFRRQRSDGTSSSSASTSSSTAKTLKKRSPSYSSVLDCTFEPRGEKSTYSPSFPSSSPPPPYSPTNVVGFEEDLVVIDEKQEETARELKLETKAERKERLKREKEEERRRESVEADGRMDAALRGMGL